MTPINQRPFKTLKYLEGITLDLRDFSYDHVKQVFHSLPQMAMPTAIAHKDWTIKRGMRNYGTELFTSEDRISCMSDPKLFSLLSQGRANCPRQPIFYGSLYSDLITAQEYTCLSEISSSLKYPSFTPDTKEPEIYTVGTWKIKQDFEVVEVIFSEEAIAINPAIKEAYEYQLKRLPSDKDPDFFIRELKLISTDFAKPKIRNLNEYNLSCIYANIVYNQHRFAGITYPSVRTGYQSNNIAIVPECLELIELESAHMYKVFKRGLRSLVTPFMECTSMGTQKNKFEWAPLAQAMTDEDIEKFFSLN